MALTRPGTARAHKLVMAIWSPNRNKNRTLAELVWVDDAPYRGQCAPLVPILWSFSARPPTSI
jgi:hypothetical protein